MNMFGRTIVAFSPPYRLKDLGRLDRDAEEKEDRIFKIRVASSKEHLDQASNLLREKYEWRGYRADRLAENPHYVTLLAYSNEELIGTMTLGVDSESGLSVDQTYRTEVNALRRQGRRVSEITKLAAENTTSSKRILAALIHITFIYARYVHERTDFLIEINPKHANYYEKRLGFRRLGKEQICERVNAPACLMHIDLDYVGEQVNLLGGRGYSGDEKTIYPYFFHKRDEEGIAARLLGR